MNLKNQLPVLARYLFGIDYLVNGLNWFIKVITPYPSQSDFLLFQPPPDVVGAMIENGYLFTLAKATELLVGVALLLNVQVPLSLVVAMTVTVPVFVIDALRPHFKLRATLMGSAAMALNLFLLATYFAQYRDMLRLRTKGSMDPLVTTEAAPAPGVDRFAALIRPLMLPFGLLSCLLGLVAVVWLGVMVIQYALDPQPLSSIHRLTPR